MADRKIGELPQAIEVHDDSLLAVEQSGRAMRMTGAQFKLFARDAVSRYVDGAKDSADSAAASAENAKKSAENAETSRKAIENMGVSAETLEPEENATVKKDIVNGVVHLTYGIPRGAKGDRGEKGDKGEKGDRGEKGETGASGDVGTTVEGFFAFHVNEEGHLILSYNDETPPDVYIDDNGHLILEM